MSHKNVLQEHYQKHKLSIPRYNTERVGGPDNRPMWQSTVSLCDTDDIVGDVCKSKSEAEQDAAYKALEKLKLLSTVIDPVMTIKKFDKRTAILIDIENMPKFFNTIPVEDLNNDNLTVYGFIGRTHCMVDRINHPKLIKIVSPSTRPDGSDTCLQLYLGMFLAQNLYDQYYFVSRDHFASTLEELVKNNFLAWRACFAKQILKYEDI